MIKKVEDHNILTTVSHLLGIDINEIRTILQTVLLVSIDQLYREYNDSEPISVRIPEIGDLIVNPDGKIEFDPLPGVSSAIDKTVVEGEDILSKLIKEANQSKLDSIKSNLINLLEIQLESKDTTPSN